MADIRPAISAIAWPQERDGEMLSLARRLGFEGLEIAPVRLFGPLAEVSADRLGDWRRRMEDEGLTVAAMQGVLFGVQGVHLFRSPEERAGLAAALREVARVAGALGIGAAVFGAPGLRDPGELEPDAAREQAVEFLRAVAPAFEAAGTALCFEPVAPALGGRFVTTTAEAIALVREVARPGIRLQIDTGNLLAHGDGGASLAEAVLLAAHFHVSEPGLVPVGSAGSDHAGLGEAARSADWRGWVSVEMLPSPDVAAAVTGAWDVVRAHYLRDKDA